MSSLRPGTVDYSRFDKIDCSDSSDDEDDNDKDRSPPRAEGGDLESDSECEEEEEEEEEEETVPAATSKRARASSNPSLATLQRAWSSSSNNDCKDPSSPPSGSGSGRSCASCAAPDPPFKCSRCRIAWYCSAACQRAYHPVHRHECIDAATHFAYWGAFGGSGSRGLSGNDKANEDDAGVRRAQQLAALRDRQGAKRRRVLQRAAAAAAVERARLAREANGTATKGGGGQKGKGGRADEREETCLICQCEFTVSGDSGVGLCCPGSHYMCSECSGVYVRSVLGDLETSYPPRCPICRVDFALEHFERQLTSAQQTAFKAFGARRALEPGQELVECHDCGFFEVVSGDSLPVILWWCNQCGKGTCFVCNKELPRGVRKYDLETSPHALCRDLRAAKALVETAIEAGGQMNCPGCGLAGRKDDACTHMNCPKCGTPWCYVCGLDVKSCDKAAPREGRPVDDIYLHNKAWETNDNRCPMYLTQILEVDLGWLGENWEENATDDDFEDDERCLDYFHRFQTIRKLQQVRLRVGPEAFEAVFKGFDSVSNSGYNLEEVVSTCTDKLIDRSEYIQYRLNERLDEDGDDDDEDEDAEMGQMEEDGEEVWEELPPEMTRAVMQDEEQLSRAMEASRESMQEGEQMDAERNVQGGLGHEQNSNDDNDEAEAEREEVWEEVPPEMTRAVVQEQEHTIQAMEASRASAVEDEHLRQVLDASAGDDDSTNP